MFTYTYILTCTAYATYLPTLAIFSHTWSLFAKGRKTKRIFFFKDCNLRGKGEVVYPRTGTSCFADPDIEPCN